MPKTYLNVTMALLTRSKYFFLMSSSVGGSFVKLGHGAGSWTTLEPDLSRHRTRVCHFQDGAVINRKLGVL